MEMEQTGKIDKIRQNRKAVTLGFGNWYNSFKEISQDFKEGDYVKIVFSEKKVDDKVFKNLKSMVKIKQEEPINIPDYMLIKEPEKVPNQTINTILMNIKDIVCCEIEQGHNFTPEELITKSEILTKMFIQDYKLIVAKI